MGLLYAPESVLGTRPPSSNAEEGRGFDESQQGDQCAQELLHKALMRFKNCIWGRGGDDGQDALMESSERVLNALRTADAGPDPENWTMEMSPFAFDACPQASARNKPNFHEL